MGVRSPYGSLKLQAVIRSGAAGSLPRDTSQRLSTSEYDKRRLNDSDGYGFFRFRTRYIPLVAALDAFPEFAACFVRLHFRAEVPAFRTLLRNRLVPAHKIAVRVVGAPVKRLAALLRPPLGNLSSILGADDARWHGSSATALRKPAAAQEEPGPPMALEHWSAALVARVGCRFRWLPVALERSSEFTRLGVVFARH